MKIKKLLFYVLAALLGGCVPVMSLHPLFTEEVLVFEENLLGTWVDDSNNIWEFKDPNEQEKMCKLIFVDNEGKKGSFVVHLVKLKNRLFMDVYPNQFPCKAEEQKHQLVEDKIMLTVKVSPKWHYNTLFFVPFHSFIKINSVKPQLKIQLTDDEGMGKLLKENPNSIKHEFVEGKPVLTASTKELQAFVLKYADDSRVFPKEIVLSRKKAEAPQQSGKQDSNESAKQSGKNKSTDEKTDRAG